MTREQIKAKKEQLAREAWEKECEAIRKRKGVGVYASEHGITAQVLNFLLKDQGRMDGEPGNFHAAEPYKQYEHWVQQGTGHSYDPEFFEGLDMSRSAIQAAEEARRTFRAAKKASQTPAMRPQNQPIQQQKNSGFYGWLKNIFGL